jgi:hypothetical protein
MPPAHALADYARANAMLRSVQIAISSLQLVRSDLIVLDQPLETVDAALLAARQQYEKIEAIISRLRRALP